MSFRKHIFLILLLLATWNVAHAQLKNSPESTIKAIEIKADRFLFWDHDVFYIKNDTVVFIPDSVDFIIRKNTFAKSDQFYDSVRVKMSKSKISSFVYDLIFKNPDSKDKPHTEALSELRYVAYRNDTINEIDFDHLDVFGTRINDTSYYKPNKYSKFLNNIHVNTRPWVVRKNMRFRQNDVLNPSDINESERLLRKLPFVMDARVFVNSSDSIDGVDVLVLTKDVFPYNVEISPGNDNDAKFGVSHNNIGGFGHKMEYDFVEEGEYEFYYTVPNILGSFIDSEIDYSNHFRKTGLGGTLTKDFVTQEIRFGGGAEISQFEFGEYDYNPFLDSTSTFFYQRQKRDFWIGRSFKTEFQSSWLGFANETYAIASARIDYQDFFDRPEVALDTNFQYHDRTNILVSIGLSSREYYKDKFILNYGRTEDIPTGTALSFVAGIQHREFDDRVYLGGNYSRGGYISNFGYLNTIFNLSSFVDEDGLVDGVGRVGIDYFSKLVILNRYKYRQFISLTYVQTIRPKEDIYIRNQNDLGIRGVSGFYLKATSKINVRVEPLLFTPLVFLGFRTAVFSFFDMTITGNSVSEFFDTDVFLGCGAGVRFRNDNLAFSTIQLRFGYYPNVPLNANTSIVDVSTSTRLGIRDFDFQAPTITAFE
ncbi:MAG: hypothetical protein JXR07_08895 [Reichenbachiella sp.]